MRKLSQSPIDNGLIVSGQRPEMRVCGAESGQLQSFCKSKSTSSLHQHSIPKLIWARIQERYRANQQESITSQTPIIRKSPNM